MCCIRLTQVPFQLLCFWSDLVYNVIYREDFNFSHLRSLLLFLPFVYCFFKEEISSPRSQYILISVQSKGLNPSRAHCKEGSQNRRIGVTLFKELWFCALQRPFSLNVNWNRCLSDFQTQIGWSHTILVNMLLVLFYNGIRLNKK